MQKRWTRWGVGAGLVAAGAVAGGILAGTLPAGADTGTTAGGAGTSTERQVDPSQPQRSDEQLLTGDTRTKVEAAVLAEYPGATIQRTETDSEGVYESDVVTGDGQRLTVQVGEDFAVTGTQQGGPGRDHRRADGDAGDQPDGTTSGG